MVNYTGLEDKLREKGIRKSDLTRELGISSRTIAKIGRGEKLSGKVLEKIADYLGCAPADLTSGGTAPSDQTVMQNIPPAASNSMKKIVIFGGGTGISAILSGLKLFPIDVTAVIAVSDDGSSTGVLKEELDIPAVGDGFFGILMSQFICFHYSVPPV